MTSQDKKYLAVKAYGVEPQHQAAFDTWLNTEISALSSRPGVAKTFKAEAVALLPGGRSLGEFTPTHIVFIELDSPSRTASAEWQKADAGELARRLDLGFKTRSYVNHTFSEMYPQKRNAPLFNEASPRTAFVILQEVAADVEADFNYWFDVDDGSAAAKGEKPISHLDERVSYPGFLRGTRFTTAAGAYQPGSGVELNPNYLTIYELDAPGALQSEAYTTAMANAGRATNGASKRLFRLVVRHAYVES